MGGEVPLEKKEEKELKTEAKASAERGRDEQDEILSKPSLEDGANWLSALTMTYLSPLLRLGASKPLTAVDLGGPSHQDTANFCVSRTKKFYEAQPAEEKDITRALISGFNGWRIVLAMTFYSISAFLQFVPVLILNDLVKYFTQYPNYKTFVTPWLEVSALFVIPVLMALLQSKQVVIMSHAAVFVRTSLSLLIYEKILRISSAGRAKTSTGAIVNMMSNDTTQIMRFIQFLAIVLVAPLQVGFALYLIYVEVGIAMLAGVGFLVCLVPVNVCVFFFVGKYRRRALKESDSRVKLINEILGGIRIIKFYAWESPFRRAIESIRRAELDNLTKLAYTAAVGFSMIMLSAPIVLPIVVFAVYIATSDTPLTAAKAFTTVALFNIMRFPFAFMPMGFLQYIQAKIALSRIDRLMALPELKEYIIFGSKSPAQAKLGAESDKTEISVHGNFSWGCAPPGEDGAESGKGRGRGKGKGKGKGKEKEKDDDQLPSTPTPNTSEAASSSEEGDVSVDKLDIFPSGPVLSDLSLEIEAGKLYGIVGPVGSGKSSLLSCILGDMEPADEDSKVFMPNRGSSFGYTGYCAQTPWIINDTLRENILFGREFDQDRYDLVTKACALADDLAVLPAADLTEIGEKGINLSGGQKARVALARALYSCDTKLLVLDDPLSAVDSHVGKHLFEEAISGNVARSTTRLLVTHHVQFLPQCYKVIVMKEGKVAHFDTYENLVNDGVDFAGAVKFKKGEEDGDEAEESRPRSSSIQSEGGASVDGGAAEDGEQGDNKKFTKEERDKGKTLTSEEEREEGAVGREAYFHYIKAGGTMLVVGFLFIQLAGKGSEVGAGFWLAHWTDDAVKAEISGSPLTDNRVMYYLHIYTVLCLGGVLALTIRAVFMAKHRLKASEKLHEDLTKSIMRAPVSYFDVTPTGRILNRFAADMDKIDLELTQSLAQGVGTVYNVLQAYVTISIATKATFLIPLVPISVLYYFIQKWFRKSSTEIQRVENITRSPIFSDFSQTLSGTNTIRAYGEEERFVRGCKRAFDVNNASYQLVQFTGNWLGIRLDTIGGFVSTFIAGLALATVKDSFIPAGWVGLALLESQQATSFLKFGVRMIAQVEAQMSSVERVLSMSRNIKPEAPEDLEGDPKPEEWPTAGRIEVEGAVMRYRDGPEVLKDITFSIEGGQKIGVVGRTGSGKSSLMTSLFRIVELSDGVIRVDGRDVSKIGTKPLRTQLSIIPQDPTIFSNTVRYNLDPFGEAEEERLWEVLDKCQMGDVVRKLPGGLDEHLAEGGTNFSQGQRQLLCISRSVLRNPKILVCDEATASIDNETDRLVQLMIREHFESATVLTIAHRLGTVMDSDKVLVLDNGKVKEFDAPAKLMRKSGGAFRAMVEASERAGGGVVQ